VAKTISAVLGAIAIGVAIGYLVWGRNGPEGTLLVLPPVLPAEYAYLDVDRVTTYLSQITNGLTSGEQRTLTHAQELAGSIEKGIKVGITQTSTASVQETITPTTTSQFSLLVRRLREGRYKSGKQWLTSFACFPSDGENAAWERLRKLPEGAFVLLRGCRVTFPDYGLIFPYFAHPPSIPLRLAIGEGKRRVNLLLPLAVTSVTDTSLFVGHSTVVGKLLRTVAQRPYADLVAWARFDQALTQLGPRLHKIPFPGSSVNEKSGMPPQEYLRRQVQAKLRLRHGAVILPIAIYK
jgi:hypothetical protein